MTKFILIAAVGALAACSQKGEVPADNAAMDDPQAAVPAIMEQGAAGTYHVQRYNGGTSTIVIRAEGSYTDIRPGGATETGTFAVKDGKRCFDPMGDAEEVCWTISQPGADGSFTATDPEGHIVTVSGGRK